MLSSTFANDLLKQLYQAVNIANIADNAATSPLTNIQVALHQTWPGAAGVQNTGEVSYTGYARVAVARTSGGWTVTGNQVSPVASILFGACTAGSATANFFSTGVASSGATKILDVGVIGGGSRIAVGFVSDTITAPAHGLVVNDNVVFWAALGQSLPAGITEGTVYFVKTQPDADNFTIAATSGGTTIDITGSGVGVAQKVTPIAISSGVTPGLSTSTIISRY